MRQTTIVKTLREGGYILNGTLVKPNGVPFQGKNSGVTAKQVARVIEITGAELKVGYDNSRKVKIGGKNGKN